MFGRLDTLLCVLGSSRKLSLLFAFLLALAGGCDTFTGSVVAMSVAWPFSPPLCIAPGIPTGCTMPPVAPTLPFAGHHVEMYAYRAGDPNPERVLANVGGQADPNSFSGFQVVPVIDPGEPCSIRGLDRDDGGCGRGSLGSSICGAQYFTQKAQKTSDDDPLSDVTLAERDRLVLQAGKVLSKLATFPSTSTDPNVVAKGRAGSTLLVLVQHNPDTLAEPRRSGGLQAITPTTAEDDAESAKRLDVCRNYRDTHPYFYVGNPKQATKPLSGVLFGSFLYQTGAGTASPDLPTQNFSAITFSVPTSWKDVVEIQVRIEPDSRTMPGGVFYPIMLGRRLPDSMAGRGTIKFGMYANTNPPGVVASFTTLVGSASVLTQLEERLN